MRHLSRQVALLFSRAVSLPLRFAWPFVDRSRRERDLDDEIRAHMAMAVQDRMARGESRETAERAVRREFGNETRVKEVTREAWGWVWLEHLLQDARFGVRSLRRNRGFACTAVLTLALGVGLTTTMYTVANGVLFRPLPFADPDRLVVVGVHAPEDVEGDLNVRDEHYEDIEREASSFAGTATYMVYPPTTLTGAGDAARLAAAWVTADFFGVLGAQPAMGRAFRPFDDEPAASAVVVLGDALWRSRFGADPAIVGTTVTLDGVPREVVGVMPPGFRFPASDLWLPMKSHPMRAEGLSYANPVVARLGDGVATDQARAELSVLAAAAEWREGPGGGVPSIRMQPLKDVVVGESRDPLVIFMGAVGLLLLISCANVAGLLVLRAGTRGQEIGLRQALGAGRPRLVRQLLTESVLLALAGGACGLAVAFVGVRSLLAIAPPGTIPRTEELGLDPTALAFTFALALITGIAFGVAPALAAGREGPIGGFTRTSRSHTGRRGGLGGAMVMAEVSLAVVLLTGAGLLLRSFQELRSIELGFEPRGTVTFYVDLPENEYGRLEPALSLHRRVLDGLGAIPRVEAAGGANFEPFGPLFISTTVRTEIGDRAPLTTGWMIASPGYFRALGVPLLSGRGFEPTDDASAPAVVVASRTMAERLWPDRDPIGERISRNRGEDWLTVVGVVEDVVLHDVTVQRGPLMYLPLEQTTDPRRLSHMSYMLRTQSSPRDVAPAIRSVFGEADANLPVGEVTSMDRVVLASFGDRLFQVRVIGVFAIFAMVLAAVGLYGVTAYSVSERKREIGIRMALGAGASKVVGSVLARGFLLAVPGLALGLVASLAVGRVIRELLYGVEPGDIATFASVAALLLTVAMAATFLPAHRAARVDPMTVLKEE